MTTTIKYNVYYSSSPEGPWTLANLTPITHSDSGNSYTITGLNSATRYYVTVLGGIEEDGEFIPLFQQPVGPYNYGLNDSPSLNKRNIMECKTL